MAKPLTAGMRVERDGRGVAVDALETLRKNLGDAAASRAVHRQEIAARWPALARALARQEKAEEALRRAGCSPPKAAAAARR